MDIQLALILGIIVCSILVGIDIFRSKGVNRRWLVYLYIVVITAMSAWQYKLSKDEETTRDNAILVGVKDGTDSLMKIRDTLLARAFKSQGVQLSFVGDTLLATSNDINNSVANVAKTQEKIRESTKTLIKNTSDAYSNILKNDSIQLINSYNTLKTKHSTITDIWTTLRNDENIYDTLLNLAVTRDAFTKIRTLINEEISNPILLKNPELQKIWFQCSYDLGEISDDILYEKLDYKKIYIRGILLPVLQRFSLTFSEYVNWNTVKIN